MDNTSIGIKKLDRQLVKELKELTKAGRSKAKERIITAYQPPEGKWGPRYRLEGHDRNFIRLNSNSYLSLSNHPALIKAADEACQRFGVGPGAVRFIDGTFEPHVALEARIARFVGMPAAKIFNSAYTSNCGVAFGISDRQTYWIGDELNHNSIIRAMRIVGVKRAYKAIYRHNDMTDLCRCFEQIPEGIRRVVVVFDGVFSMRGDYAPINRILETIKPFEDRFDQGLITMADDSHGIGAYGPTGRGTAEVAQAQPDIIVGTFGKAFGVNGGFVASSQTVVESVRQRADTYIYTNPLSPADCAAAIEAINICDSTEGIQRLDNLKKRQKQLRQGIKALGIETIEGVHPVVPLMIRDSEKTRKMVEHFFKRGTMVIGLAFPVVPAGDEKLRIQINAAHTAADIDEVLSIIADFKYSS